jgi:hypothetical protein
MAPSNDEPTGGQRSRDGLDAELAAMRAQVAHLRSENARLLRLLDLTPAQAIPPGPVQTGIFDAAPGSVHVGSSPAMKVAFFAALFSARTDVYAVRWENRTPSTFPIFRHCALLDLSRALADQGPGLGPVPLLRGNTQGASGTKTPDQLAVERAAPFDVEGREDRARPRCRLAAVPR